MPQKCAFWEDLRWRQALRRDKELDTAYTLTQPFRRLTRHRTDPALDPWLVDCLASGTLKWVNFASCLQREQPAVQAALDLPYNIGQVEGQVTQLPRLKPSAE